MIKTLHITSIIVTVLAAGLFVFPVVFGFRGDDQIEKFLTAPSFLDQFRKNAGHTTRAGSDETSPLVAQAGSFGLILNPPPKPVVTKDTKPTTGGHKPPPPPPVSAKFKVVATSYNQSRPEESLALIDEPGKGLHWVRQADVIGHLTIEVQDGTVLAKAGNKTETLTVPHKPYMSLIAGESEVPFPAETSTPTVTPVLRKGSRGKGSVSRPRAGKTGNTGAAATASPTINEEDFGTLEEQKAAAEKIFAELKAMAREQSDTTSSAGNDQGSAAGAKGTGITGTEADKIGDLGRELENVESSPSDRAKQLKQRRAERSEKLRERIEKARRTRK